MEKVNKDEAWKTSIGFRDTHVTDYILAKW